MRIFLPRIEYVYEVDGETYHGKTITEGTDQLTWFTGNPEKARTRSGQYPEGAAVTVYYDPHRPANACLERSRGNFILAYCIPAICLAGGLAIGYMIVMSLLPA